MINHLGKNPKNGGSPPNESIELNKENFKMEEFINIEYIWFK